MKAARTGFEGVNKVYYESLHARIFIITNEEEGRGQHYQRQATLKAEQAQSFLADSSYFCPFQAYLKVSRSPEVTLRAECHVQSNDQKEKEKRKKENSQTKHGSLLAMKVQY